MPATPSPADTLAAARSHLRDALAYLNASGIAVELRPVSGSWRYYVGGAASTEGGIVALASLMQPVGAGRVQ